MLDTISSSGGLKLSENVGTRNGTVTLILDPQWRVENEIRRQNLDIGLRTNKLETIR